MHAGLDLDRRPLDLDLAVFVRLDPRDQHAGPWHRQVSFLAGESIEKARKGGLDVTFGDFAENIATQGIDWLEVPLGTKVNLGKAAQVKITQIGKECHNKCSIYYLAGDCIMPREGIFARVLKGGKILLGDTVQLVSEHQERTGHESD